MIRRLRLSFLLVAVLSLAVAAMIAIGFVWPDRAIGVIAVSFSLVWAAAACGLAVLLPLFAPPGARTVAAACGLALAGSALWLPVREQMSGGDLSPVPSGAEQLVVVSANVYHANADPEAVTRALIAQHADIVMLQEAGGTAYDALQALDRAYPYKTRCRPGCDLQIRSRLPILPSRRWTRLRELRPMGLNAIWAHIDDGSGKPIRVVTTHFPQAVPLEKQRRFRFALTDALRAIADEHLIFSGDFNSTPWMKAMGQQDALLAPLRRLTRNLPTYPAQMSIGGTAIPLPFSVLPIDHVYAGPGWNVASVATIRLPGSDHRGVRIVLWRLKPDRRVHISMNRDISCRGSA